MTRVRALSLAPALLGVIVLGGSLLCTEKRFYVILLVTGLPAAIATMTIARR